VQVSKEDLGEQVAVTGSSSAWVVGGQWIGLGTLELLVVAVLYVIQGGEPGVWYFRLLISGPRGADDTGGGANRGRNGLKLTAGIWFVP
jgi:hypothetical protein